MARQSQVRTVLLTILIIRLLGEKSLLGRDPLITSLGEVSGRNADSCLRMILLIGSDFQKNELAGAACGRWPQLR
jgi:hypothetical protein